MLAFALPPESVKAAAQALKGELGFDLLLDVTAVDWLGQTPRFEVVWHFWSTTRHLRVRLKARVGGDDPAVDSFCPASTVRRD